jgi:hypothetical protein
MQQVLLKIKLWLKDFLSILNKQTMTDVEPSILRTPPHEDKQELSCPRYCCA